jgi:hypothetical protein
MIRLNKSLVLFFLCFFFLFPFRQYGQNLYDAYHTEKYASHLFSLKQYEAAALEYKRLAMLVPKNDTVIKNILVSYRLSANYDSGVSYYRLRYQQANDTPTHVIDEYAKSLMLSGKYKEADSLLCVTKALDSETVKKYKFYNYALLGDWGIVGKEYKSGDFFLSNNHLAWGKLLVRQQNIKYKSPGLALALSTVVPGSGKIYTGAWKDGVLSFIMIGSLAYESYTGFRAKGTNSALGWIFGGLAVGFYGGNIYGSWKSAKRYNQLKNNGIHNEAEKLVVSGF